jgi:hypothetical protein
MISGFDGRVRRAGRYLLAVIVVALSLADTLAGEL